ncbi:trehalose synthase [Longilinea arvoryzae]|uniref:maltose alpha-D-glucosyltransferase n=1 Tax=Longilinea arvoryzae TaxID=360412 RepID=A0A0S7BLH4_9CHLR|nr:maltose alpha-D-glucosyltransferase [Longilinea arvoryzae]GAP15523.1 trehalose synthase [Longilinea arvoryzae]
MAQTSNVPWYKQAVFYEVIVRAFYDSDGDGHGDLWGLMHRLDYLQRLGIDCIWLLPIYPSPLRDDGYDIADYYNVLPTYGSLDDFKALVKAVHQRGMRIITDLVLNHTSDQHPWFQAALADRNSPYRDYYVWSDSDRKYKDARIIFLDTEKSNWTWNEQAGQFYWHRFYSSQPDLNFDNPAVRAEMLNVMRFWLDLGIDGFRTDAVPYLFEREGTNCENLPETHAYLKELRRFMDDNYPGRILLCEANQWPEDVRPYFGDGDEFHMGFHFPSMPRIFMSIRAGDASSLIDILDRTPAIPDNCQWCNFLRNHDELTLEMVTPEEREYMWREYAPEPRMRLNLGIRRRLAPLLDNDPRKIGLANSLLFTLPGSPIIYYGDEIGMGDNIQLFDRNGVRTPMQWTGGLNAGFSDAAPEKLYAPLIDDTGYTYRAVNVAREDSDPNSRLNFTRKLISTRKQAPALVRGGFTWVQPGQNPALAAYLRATDEQSVLALHNLSDQAQPFAFSLSHTGVVRDLLDAAKDFPVEGELRVSLAPYEFRWLELP